MKRTDKSGTFEALQKKLLTVSFCTFFLFSFAQSAIIDYENENKAFDGTRPKRDLNSIYESNESKGIPIDDNNDKNDRIGKEGLTNDDLETGLMHFNDKEDSEEEPMVDKRVRYFLGKRLLSEADLQKRLRYFLGKRSDENDYDKRMRYFVGKREGTDEKEPMKRMRYFVGKRSDDDDLEKRMRYFVGKRMRYFVGKRYGNDPQTEEHGGLPEKRMRYFVGKRDGPMNTSNTQLDGEKSKRTRYFLGKRLRYFLG